MTDNPLMAELNARIRRRLLHHAWMYAIAMGDWDAAQLIHKTPRGVTASHRRDCVRCGELRALRAYQRLLGKKRGDS